MGLFIKKKKTPEIESKKEYIERLKKTIVVINPGGKVYHTKYKCPNVVKSGKSISLYEAKKLGCRECAKCQAIPW